MINSFRGAYRFLSNFYPAPVIYDLERYETVEHAYQAAKTNSIEERALVKKCATPGAAKRIGRSFTLRHDWNEMRLSIMLGLLRQKFKDPKLAFQLLLTDSQELVEGNHWGDKFWGVCGGMGENHLGRLLMQIREELKWSGSV